MGRKIGAFTSRAEITWLLMAMFCCSFPSIGWCQNPLYEAAQRAILQYFQTIPDFRTTDLITQEEVEPLLARLERMGFPLPDKKKLLERVPAKGEFLVDQLSTPDGRNFMRRIAKYPEAFDRLDRLSRLPHGKQTIRDLIKGPGGDKMIQYLTTTPGGKETGKMLSEAPKGAKFNASTGRIYTVDLLLQHVKKSLAATQKAAPSADAPDTTPSS